MLVGCTSNCKVAGCVWDIREKGNKEASRVGQSIGIKKTHKKKKLEQIGSKHGRKKKAL